MRLRTNRRSALSRMSEVDRALTAYRDAREHLLWACRQSAPFDATEMGQIAGRVVKAADELAEAIMPGASFSDVEYYK